MDIKQEITTWDEQGNVTSKIIVTADKVVFKGAALDGVEPLRRVIQEMDKIKEQISD